jgi:hypothetical protein
LDEALDQAREGMRFGATLSWLLLAVRDRTIVSTYPAIVVLMKQQLCTERKVVYSRDITFA